MRKAGSTVLSAQVKPMLMVCGYKPGKELLFVWYKINSKDCLKDFYSRLYIITVSLHSCIFIYMHFITAFGYNFIPYTWIFGLYFIIHLYIHLLAYSHIAHVLSTLLMDLAFIHINFNNSHNILISGILFIL